MDILKFYSWRHLIWIGILVLLSSSTVYAQVFSDQHDISFTLPEVALIDVEPDGSAVILSLNIPLDAGSPLIVGTTQNQTKWLNYSSSVAATGSTRTITAHFNNNILPKGLIVKLEVSAYTGSGAGVFGKPSSPVILDVTPKAILSGIGGCFTGDGTGNGHQLKYSVEITDYSALSFDQSDTMEIIFTITD